MENVTLQLENFMSKYVAADGYVITNYKEGDSQIVFSKSLLFKPTSEPVGFYTMVEADAQAIRDKFNAEAKARHEAEEAERKKMMHHDEVLEETSDSSTDSSTD